MARMVSLLLTGVLTGCTATRSTVHLARAEQAVELAREAQAPEQSPYAWTLAEQLMLKAREEWAAASFGASEALSKRAVEAANKAAEQATSNPSPLDIPDWADLPEAEDVEEAVQAASPQPGSVQ